MKLIKPLSFLLFLMLYSSTLTAQNRWKLDVRHEKSLLIEDLTQLEYTLKNTHENPYRYCRPQDLDLAFSRCRESITDNCSTLEFAALIGELLQNIQDSHSSVNFTAIIQHHLESGGGSFLFEVFSIDTALYITNDQQALLPAGARLLSINGQPASKLFEEVNKFSVMEGPSTVGKRRIADMIFPSLAAAILMTSDSAQIAYMTGDTTKHCRYPMLSEKEFKKHQKKIRKGSSPWSYAQDDHEIWAKIEISSFADGSALSYQRFLKKSFKAIEKEGIRELIIDLRNNTGGYTNRMRLLLDYITEGDLAIPDNVIFKQSDLSLERTHLNHKGLQKFFIEHFFRHNEDVQIFKQMTKTPLGERDTLYYKGSESVTASKSFQGNTYLIINGGTGSASANMAAYWKTKNLGPIFGEPCLGSINGTWGNPHDYTLKNSNLKLNTSTIRLNVNHLFFQPDETVNPDIEITLSPLDILQGIDPVMEELIRNFQ